MQPICRSISLLLVPLWFGSTALAQGTAPLISAGSVWKFLDDGSDQGIAWRQPGFDDSAWLAGPAQLGYGDGDERTTVSPCSATPGQSAITTYFRHVFQVPAPNPYLALRFEVLHDDGVVLHLNGHEIRRENMPTRQILASTPARSDIEGIEESTYRVFSVPATHLASGKNTLAVEIHQSSPRSDDISFDLVLQGERHPRVVRGPYLQNASPTEITIMWRTNGATDSRILYGASPTELNQQVNQGSHELDHAVRLSGLEPETTYHYAVGTGSQTLSAGPDHFFVTGPPTGKHRATRIWALGDSGTANRDAKDVRDAFHALNSGPRPDVWLMLGDNADPWGTDRDYQRAVFDMYPLTLRQTALWPARGNHDTWPLTYYAMFDLPTRAEAGGVPSGTEAYYSFDHANIHFVCLDSFGSDRTIGGPMYTWLQRDLADTTQDWIIAFWHHPPYTRGTSDSDTETILVEMRTPFLPLPESHGGDLVIAGHSHVYERSYLIDGHYGVAHTFSDRLKKDPGSGNPALDGPYVKAPIPHAGTVYAVAGSSGQTGSGPLNHPAMVHAASELGSLVIDVLGPRLEARFLDARGMVRDTFTLVSHPITGLSSTTTTTSLLHGGTQRLELDAGDANAGRVYILAGSVTGTCPGTLFGNVKLPLVTDDYFLTTFEHPNTTLLRNGLGLLDAAGRARVTFTIPRASHHSMLGLTIHHAFAVLDLASGGNVTFVSNPFPLTLLR